MRFSSAAVAATTEAASAMPVVTVASADVACALTASADGGLRHRSWRRRPWRSRPQPALRRCRCRQVRWRPERSRWPAKRRQRWPRRRSQAARSPCRMQASRRKPPLPALQRRDGDGNGIGGHRGRAILPRLGLILLPRTSSSEACLVSSDLPSISTRRISIWHAGRFRPCGPCRLLRRLWHRHWRRRVRLAAASRSSESLRAALSDAALSARRCRARRLSDAAASRRRGAGRALGCPERDCRCCWRPHCCRPAPQNCRFRPTGRNPAGRTSPRALKRRVCQYF